MAENEQNTGQNVEESVLENVREKFVDVMTSYEKTAN